MKQWAKQTGFTIVELLIVIVVIAILAAISIVAYNGIQLRARNANTAAVVSAYQKALIQYATVNGSYPPITNGSGGAYACFGENNPGDLCWSRSVNQTVETASFNDAIKPYLGNRIPDVNPTMVGAKNGAMFVNHTSASVTLDGVQYRYYIVYLMEGTGMQCPIGPVLSGAWATFTSTIPASGYTLGVGGVGTECWIKMPDPATL